MRMSNLVACILRPQLREMSERGKQWNHIYTALEQRLNTIEAVSVPERVSSEDYVASSIQFKVSGLNQMQLQALSDNCTARGVAIKWFGRGEPMGYTSLYTHWKYLKQQNLPNTTEVLETTCDMRIPMSLTDQDCDQIKGILQDELNKILV